MRSPRTLIVAVTALVLALGTTPAEALTLVRVRAGNAPSGTLVGFTVASTGAVSFTDVTAAQQATCTRISSIGRTRTGARAGASIATVSGPRTKLLGCTAFSGAERFAGVGANTWRFNVASVVRGVAYGTLSGITANLTGTGVTSCTFTMSGSVAARYVDATHRLVVPGRRATLTVSKAVPGCFVIKNGDKVSIAATLVVTATHASWNPITFRNR